MSGMKPRTALVGCLAGLLAASAGGAAAGDALDITYAGGLLTVRCADAGLADVLEQIRSATGMTLVLDDAVKSAVVTVDIEAQPVQAALERLLEGRGVSYAMSLSPDGKKVAQMFVGSGTEARSASAAGNPSRPGAPAPAAHRAPEPPAPAAPHLPLPAIGSDDEEDIDTEADDPSPFAAMAAEGVPGLPTAPAPAPAVPAGANARPATQGTPPVPITFPGSSQPYYPVLDPFGRPIPMPQPTPAAPPVDQQKPAAPVNQ
jgi:hypothetical protein